MAEKVVKRRPRFILVSDLDWTMVDHNDKDNKALLAFNNLWEEHFRKDCLLVFSTGRSHALYSQLREEVPLTNPDILVCSVGTEIFFEATSDCKPIPDQKWTQLLDVGWDRDAVQATASSFAGFNLQGETEQRPHKVSFHVSLKGQEAEAQVQKLQESLRSQNISAKVIYSGGEDLDVLPEKASKGKGLEFLLQEIEDLVGLPEDGVLVNGDSGNDIELFQVPDVRGTMVANAHPELKAWVDAHPSPDIFKATQRCAGGIVESMRHFQILQSQDE